jgi:hypothetical protein
LENGELEVKNILKIVNMKKKKKKMKNKVIKKMKKKVMMMMMKKKNYKMKIYKIIINI